MQVSCVQRSVVYALNCNIILVELIDCYLKFLMVNIICLLQVTPIPPSMSVLMRAAIKWGKCHTMTVVKNSVTIGLSRCSQLMLPEVGDLVACTDCTFVHLWQQHVNGWNIDSPGRRQVCVRACSDMLSHLLATCEITTLIFWQIWHFRLPIIRTSKLFLLSPNYQLVTAFRLSWYHF